MAERTASRSRPDAPTRRRTPDMVGTLPVAAVTAALWAAGVGLIVIGVLVTVSWAISGRGDDGLSTPISATGVFWLAAHHAPVETAVTTVTLLPLGLFALVATLLYRAGRWAVRITATTSVADAALLVVAATATYSALAFLVAQASSIAGAQVAPLAALGWSALVSAGALSAGVVRGGALAGSLRDRLPVSLHRAALAAAMSGALIGVGVCLVAIAAVVGRWSTVAGLSHQLAPGLGDAVGLFLVSLAYLPNLLVWALSYVAGPGFAIGGGASVDPFSAAGGLLPGVPLLGAIPLDAPVAAPALLLLPVLAGALSTVVLRRRMSLPLAEEMAAVLTGAALVGAASVVLCALAGGSLGSARLVGLGPPALLTGIALAALVAAGGALASLVPRLMPHVWVHEQH